METYENIVGYLGDKASFYLDHVSEKIVKGELQLPNKNVVGRVFVNSNRKPQVLGSLTQLYDHGNLQGTGHLS